VAIAEQPGTLAPDDASGRAEVDALLDRSERSRAHPPLSEASRLAWAAHDVSEPTLVLRADGAVVASAHLGRRDGAWNVEIVTDPEGDTTGWGRSLLEAAISEARRNGAAEVRYWVVQHRLEDDAVPLGLGFSVERDLLQMRVPLPINVERPPRDARFTLRPFRPGQDEAAWLEVNNRAFAAHPEQGHWELPTLLAREHTDWFDPDGFIVCEEEGRIAGSCWTKVHRGTDPQLGEIYVISVDPAMQSHGLGRILVVAGLDWLATRVQMGMLYVEQDNAKAVELYRSLGFRPDHVDRCYLWRP
jgi:mycothiol synthase